MVKHNIISGKCKELKHTYMINKHFFSEKICSLNSYNFANFDVRWRTELFFYILNLTLKNPVSVSNRLNKNKLKQPKGKV